jgi:NNP family nitrate/nitrite transporter-like MFS transporter
MGHLRLFLRSGNPRALLAAFVYFDTSFMVWVLLGGLGNFIASDLDLHGTQKGLMTALPLLSGALLRIPMGIAADRYGSRHVGIIGLSLTAVPLLAGWLLADHVATIYLVGLLLGVAGSSFAVALPLASRWYPPEQQGLALGIAGAGNSGTVLASLFAPRLAELLGWHAVFGLAMLPILASLGLYLAFAKDNPDAPRSTVRLSDYFAILRQKDALRFCVLYSVTFGGFVGLASYLAIFLRDQYGISRVGAGDLTAMCVFAGSFARPIGGLAADRFGGVRVLLGLLSAIAILSAGVSSLPALTPAVVLLLVMMAALGMSNGAVFQLVPQRFPREIGVLTGLVGFAGGLGGFLLPFGLGLLKDWTGGYGAGFLVYTSAALATSIILLMARLSWQRTWAPHGSAAMHGRARIAASVAES